MNSKKDSGRRRSRADQRPDGPHWRVVMHDIIFESDTRSGWIFDVALLVVILCSIAIVSIETIPSIDAKFLPVLNGFEWFLTILFTIEYIARLSCARHPLRYAISFWGIIDLLSILPTYIGLFLVDGHADSFVILRSIRLLRAFRVLKLWRMMRDAEELYDAIWKARHKIVVFLIVVLVAVTISGTLMYFVENVMPRISAKGNLPEAQEEFIESQFDSIPQAMYWAIVTMTTVGYGDIVPKTVVGKFISATLILLGYSLIIVPSSFVTAELTSRGVAGQAKGTPDENDETELTCPRCASIEHREDAEYCFRCGERF